MIEQNMYFSYFLLSDFVIYYLLFSEFGVGFNSPFPDCFVYVRYKCAPRCVK